MGAEGHVLVAFGPCLLHVDEREVGDIERIGDLAEKAVDGFGAAALCAARRMVRGVVFRLYLYLLSGGSVLQELLRKHGAASDLLSPEPVPERAPLRGREAARQDHGR